MLPAVTSPPFPPCWFQLNVFISLSKLMLDLLTMSSAHIVENLWRSSSTSMMALEYIQEFIYHGYTFYTVLLQRNTFKEYRVSWLEALGDLAQYSIVVTAMIPAHTRTSSSLTTAAGTNGLCSSSVGSTTSLSRTLSSTSSEEHPARPDSTHSKRRYPRSKTDGTQTPRMTAGGGLRVTGTLRLSLSSLGVASCTTIWGFSAAGQVESRAVYTTSRGGQEVSPLCWVYKYNFSFQLLTV